MVWVATKAFSIMAKNFGPPSQHKFCVGIGFGAGTRCLGRDKGPLVSRQSFPKGGTFLSRSKNLCRDRVFEDGVVTGCFSVVTHKALGAHDRPGHTREHAHQRRYCAQDRAARVHSARDLAYDCAHDRRDRDSFTIETSLSRQTCPIAKKKKSPPGIGVSHILHPPALPQVEVPLCKNVLQTFVV